MNVVKVTEERTKNPMKGKIAGAPSADPVLTGGYTSADRMK